MNNFLIELSHCSHPLLWENIRVLVTANMSVVCRRSVQNCSNYIQNTLRYLAQNDGYHSELYQFNYKEHRGYNLIQAEINKASGRNSSELTIDIVTNDILSEGTNCGDITIDADNYEVLSEVGNETIDLDQSFTKANISVRDDEYEVLSEVGEDAEVDITINQDQYEILSEVGDPNN